MEHRVVFCHSAEVSIGGSQSAARDMEAASVANRAAQEVLTVSASGQQG